MSSASVKKRVLQLWDDPKVGQTGLVRFLEKLKSKGIEVAQDDLKTILQHRRAHDLHVTRSGRNRLQSRRGNTITESSVGAGFQIDLMDMSLLATRNRGFCWVLTAIDVYSRYAWAIPVKRKTQGLMKAALETLLLQAKRTPQRITSDNGKEFVNAAVQALFRKNSIQHYTTQVGDKRTTGLVERFNRTLRELMGRNFARLGKLHWVDDLPGLLHNYNHSVHSTIRQTPHNVWHKKVRPAPRKIYREPFPFHEGQPVRTLLPRELFDKRAGAQKWSDDIFTIARRDGFKYVLHDANGKEASTKYRPAQLYPVSMAVFAELKLQQQKRTKTSTEAQRRLAQKKKRNRAYLKRQGLDSRRIKRTRTRARGRR